MKGLPFDPAENGFVYASAEIARESARRDRFEDAKLAEKAGFNLAEFQKLISSPPNRCHVLPTSPEGSFC
jgi:hypothetical protein